MGVRFRELDVISCSLLVAPRASAGLKAISRLVTSRGSRKEEEERPQLWASLLAPRLVPVPHHPILALVALLDVANPAVDTGHYGLVLTPPLFVRNASFTASLRLAWQHDARSLYPVLSANARNRLKLLSISLETRTGFSMMQRATKCNVQTENTLIEREGLEPD